MEDFEKAEPPLNGAALEWEVLNGDHSHNPIVCDFLYEHAVLMMYSDGGKGKSTLTLQAALEISCGLPVWGYLPVPKPRQVYYIQFERHKSESMDRLKDFREKYNSQYENLWVDTGMTDYNIEYKEYFKAVSNRIDSVCKPDLVILDPIYGCVEGALSEEKPAKTIIRLSKALLKRFNCAVWMNHHNPKDMWTQEGKKVEKDTPYGCRHFNSHITMQYFLSQENKTVSVLRKQKDNWNVGFDKIPLNYDSEYQMSIVDPSVGGGMTLKDRVIKFLKECKTVNKKPTFEEIDTNLVGCATRSLRRFLADMAQPNIVKHKSNGHATLYEHVDSKEA